MKRGRRGRSPAQEDYIRRNQKCKVCGRPAHHVHHINHRRNDDRDENLESLCQEHHTGNKGIHIMSEVVWIEINRLTVDPKWKWRYEILKGKQRLRDGAD